MAAFCRVQHIICAVRRYPWPDAKEWHGIDRVINRTNRFARNSKRTVGAASVLLCAVALSGCGDSQTG
ncbi:hypothetical protein ABQF26_28270, partial [Mycolicibacterium elephantis]